MVTTKSLINDTKNTNTLTPFDSTYLYTNDYAYLGNGTMISVGTFPDDNDLLILFLLSKQFFYFLWFSWFKYLHLFDYVDLVYSSHFSTCYD